MKGSITVEFSAKEAVAIISDSTLPKSVTTKVITALRRANVRPQGAKASAISRATTRATTKAVNTEKAAAAI